MTTTLQTAESILVEHIGATSSALFLHDNFDLDIASDAPIYRIQTRNGAGNALVGYLKTSSPSKPVAVLATPTALERLAPLIASLPPPSERSPIALHIAAAEPMLDEEAKTHLQAVPGLRGVLAALPCLSNTAVLLSGSRGAQSILDTARAADKLLAQGQDVVHVYDAISAGREQQGGLQLAGGMDVDVQTSTKRADLASEVARAGVEAFAYDGPANPRAVVVIPDSLHAATAKTALAREEQVGVVVVSVPRPWQGEQLAAVIPSSTRSVHVYTEAGVGGRALFDDVLGTLTGGTARVVPMAVESDKIWSIGEWREAIERLPTVGSSTDNGIPEVQDLTLLDEQSKLAVFWSPDDIASAHLAAKVTERFVAQRNGVQARLLTEYDNYAGKTLGLQRSVVLLPSHEQAPKSQSMPLTAIAGAVSPSLLFLSNPASFLSSYSVLETLGAHSEVVFSCNWQPDEILEKLSPAQKASMAARILGEKQLYLLDAAAVEGAEVAEVEETAFWVLYLGKSATDSNVASVVGKEASFVGRVREVLRAFEVPKEGEGQPAAAGEVDGGASGHALEPLPVHIVSNGKAPNHLKQFPDVAPTSGATWHEAAKRFIFSEAYGVDPDGLRPDLPEETFVVSVTENRRLTPLDYDRNVFHLEFSTEGTGLKYAVGEALGVHGHNDAAEVMEFIEWFGLDPDSSVSFPSNSSPHAILETRTVFQVFQQNLDIFGRPPKSFYEALSNIATNRDEARTLRFIGSAEGSSTFKKYAEVDTVTYADVLKEFPSTKAALGLEGLLREVQPLKPRHYSIASSQNAVGDSVHLLVVTVDWETKRGASMSLYFVRYSS